MKEDFNQALLHGDWKALEQIEADDLIFTNADGSVTHKSDDVANLTSGDLKISSMKPTSAVPTASPTYGPKGAEDGG